MIIMGHLTTIPLEIVAIKVDHIELMLDQVNQMFQIDMMGSIIENGQTIMMVNREDIDQNMTIIITRPQVLQTQQR